MDPQAPSGFREESDVARRLLLALGIIVAFLAILYVRRALWAIPVFAALYRTHSPQLATVLWKATQVLLVPLAVLLFVPGGLRGALRSLGLGRGFASGMGWALLATLPALLGFALFGELQRPLLTWYLVMTAVASPLSGEMLFRGFLFRQLYQAARWPFWLAVLVNALPFALGHLYQATSVGAGLLGTAGVLLFTGAGAAFFAWLLARWSWSLWPAIGFHAFANLWEYAFHGPDGSVLVQPYAVPFVIASVLAMIGITVWKTGGWKVSRMEVSAPEAAAAALAAGR